MMKRLIVPILCVFASVSALAFGGGGGRSAPGLISTTYKAGVDAIGIHFGGDADVPCPEHSTKIQGLCFCDEYYTPDGMGGCVADQCLEYVPTDCMPDCDPITGDPISGNDGKYCNNKMGRCSLGACLPIVCAPCEDLVDGLCVARACGDGEVCNTAQNACLCDTANKYYGETGNCQLCNGTGSIFKNATCQCDNENDYYGEANNCAKCEGTGTIISNNTCVCDNVNNYYGQIESCNTCDGANREIKDNDCVCINGYEEYNDECVEKCADGYQRNQQTGECELTCTPGVDTCGDNECYICNEETSTCQNACIPVDYLESTGTQYIDTGIIRDLSYIWKFVGSFNYSNITERQLNGAQGFTYLGVINGYYQVTGAGDRHEDLAAVANEFIPFEVEFDCPNNKYSYTINNQSSANQTVKGDDEIYWDIPPEAHFHIFSLNDAVLPSSCKIPYFKLYKNNTLVRDFIPVHVPFHPFGTRNCMFDQVSKKLFCNQGGGNDFNIPTSDDLEPGACKTDADCLAEGECYTCNQKTKTCEYACENLEYLESTGTQYIDTGIVRDLSYMWKFVGSFNYSNITKRQLIGAQGYTYIGVVNGYYQVTGATNNHIEIPAVANEFTPFEVEFNCPQNKMSYTIRGISVSGQQALSSYVDSPARAHFCLFSLNSAVLPSSCKIPYFKLYKNNTLIRDFIPVLDPDGTPAMFDRVENKLYYNKGSGQFLYGPVVNE